MADQAKLLKPDLDFVREIRAAGGESVKKCFQCATCSVVCNMAPKEKPFPRKEMIWAQWGLKDRLVGDPDIWLCHQCSDCTAYCPRGAKPGEVLGAIRKMAIQSSSPPSALGKLVGSPGGLVPLLLLPVVIFGAIAMSNAKNISGPIVYSKMIHTLQVDAVFIPAALFAVISFFLGITKYWSAMVETTGIRPQGSWVGALVDVVKEFLTHKRFDKCDVQKGRSKAHLFTFYGFVGLAITTTIALVYEWGTHFGLLNRAAPYLMSDPVKWIGFVGMASLLFGIFQIYTNRTKNADKAGKGGYFDWLFIAIVAAVGLSGALSWGFRAVLNVAALAYPTYFIHLVAVFFLFAYAPFSKMAHMVYRTTALVFAKMAGRE